jgi:hypothetical protein
MLGLAFLSQCRKSIARQWLWAASCDLGWIGLSALLIAARPHSAAGKLCLVVFVLLFVRHVLWAKILRKSGIAKAVSPKTGEGPSAARVRPVGVDNHKGEGPSRTPPLSPWEAARCCRVQALLDHVSTCQDRPALCIGPEELDPHR